MGKFKGGRGRGRGRRDEDEDFDYRPPVGGQPATAGMLPPSDSEDESGDESGEEQQEQVPKVVMVQNPKAGQMPTDSEEESGSEEDSGSEEEEEEPMPLRPAVGGGGRRKKGEEEPDPEQMRKDLERLALIRKKREEDRLKRIAEEGFDRYAPPAEGNQRALPKDHPSLKQKE